MYGQGSEKVLTADGAYPSVIQPMLMSGDPQIQRTRKTLIILLGVLLALTVIGSISTALTPTTSAMNKYNQPGAQFGSAVISILFYTFGIFVAHRYHATGLRVFAWLTVVELVVVGILGVLVLFALIASLVAGSVGADPNGLMALSLMLLCAVLIALAVVFALAFVIVRFSFRLARLIEAYKKSTSQQI